MKYNTPLYFCITVQLDNDNLIICPFKTFEIHFSYSTVMKYVYFTSGYKYFIIRQRDSKMEITEWYDC